MGVAMAASGYVAVQGTISGLATGTRNIAASISSATANGSVTQVVLQSGANTITVPTTPAPTGCVIQLPSTNTAVTTLKGISGDTGIAIGKTGFLVLTWDPTSPPASFVLNSASTQTGLVTEILFF
jgi:hypothetical protein